MSCCVEEARITSRRVLEVSGAYTVLWTKSERTPIAPKAAVTSGAAGKDCVQDKCVRIFCQDVVNQRSQQPFLIRKHIRFIRAIVFVHKQSGVGQVSNGLYAKQMGLASLTLGFSPSLFTVFYSTLPLMLVIGNPMFLSLRTHDHKICIVSWGWLLQEGGRADSS